MADFSQIITKTYNTLGMPSDIGGNYDSETVVKPKINSLVDRICKGQIRDIFTDKSYRSGDLPFTRKTKFYQLVVPKTLQVALTSSSTEIDIGDTTYYANSGYVYIDSEVIHYTGKNSTELTGVTGITIDHQTAVRVYQLYDMPDDISQPFTMFYIDLAARNGRQYEISYWDVRFPLPWNYYYTVVQNNDDVKLFHVMGFNNNNDRTVLYYYINSTDMVANNDECIIPNPWALEVIPQIAAAELLYENEEYIDSQSKAKNGYSKLTEMDDYFTKAIKRSRETVKMQPWNFTSIRGYGYYGYYGGRGRSGN